MDVTPQELRGSEIKEAWRGFNRDEVDDLLERAAVTIESLTRQVQELDARAPADPDALPTNRDEAEMLQRTLLLAQRAADDAVNEAQAQARRLIEESEARAQALVGEAEATARRIAEGERRRLEDEIQELTRRREQLAVDADALEEYVASYRERVRSVIEADLERLGHDSIAPPAPRPELHRVEPEPAPEPAPEPEPERLEPVERLEGEELVPEPRVTPMAADAARGTDPEWPPPADPSPASASVAAPRRGVVTPAVHAESSSPWLADAEASTPEALADPPAPWERATAEHQPFAADTPIEATAIETDDKLDDDAFFASLREAVRDDAPLGPRDEHNSFFDDEPAEERRGHFRRRR
jgi:cell division initiation protein